MMARLNYGWRISVLNYDDVMDFIESISGFRLLYPLQETDGAVAVATNPEIGAVAASTSYPGPELLIDGDMEAVGIGSWPTGTVATSKETTTPHGGSQCLRLTYNGTVNGITGQNVLTIGQRFQGAGYARGNGAKVPAIYSGSIKWQGTALTTWQSFDFEFVATNVYYYLMLLASSAGYCEFDDLTVRESNLLNGDIIGATIGQAVPFPLLYMVSLDGINDYISIGSTALDAIWDGDLFTLSGFIIANSGMFTDTVQRAFINIGADANNYVQVGSDGAGNLQALVKSGGTLKTLTYASPSEDVLLHWSVKRNGANCELVVNGINRDTDTGLPAWSGSLDATLCVIGAGSTGPINCYAGKIGAVAYHHAEVDNGNLMKLAHMAGAG